jgi:hypothetical protein
MGIATDNSGNLVATSYTAPSQFELINVVNGTSQIVGNIGGGIANVHGGDIQLTPTPTPIPAAAWLFGSGLMGLAGVRRRKKM